MSDLASATLASIIKDGLARWGEFHVSGEELRRAVDPHGSRVNPAYRGFLPTFSERLNEFCAIHRFRVASGFASDRFTFRRGEGSGP